MKRVARYLVNAFWGVVLIVVSAIIMAYVWLRMLFKPKFLPVLVVCLLAGCASGGHPDYTGWLGFNLCQKGRAVGFVSLEALDDTTMLRNEHIAHERKHREQIRRHASCKAWETFASVNRLELEAEAYCEDVKVTAARGVSFEVALAYWALWMSDVTGRPETYTAALILKFCHQPPERNQL